MRDPGRAARRSGSGALTAAPALSLLRLPPTPSTRDGLCQHPRFTESKARLRMTEGLAQTAPGSGRGTPTLKRHSEPLLFCLSSSPRKEKQGRGRGVRCGTRGKVDQVEFSSVGLPASTLPRGSTCRASVGPYESRPPAPSSFRARANSSGDPTPGVRGEGGQ